MGIARLAEDKVVAAGGIRNAQQSATTRLRSSMAAIQPAFAGAFRS